MPVNVDILARGSENALGLAIEERLTTEKELSALKDKVVGLERRRDLQVQKERCLESIIKRQAYLIGKHVFLRSRRGRRTFSDNYNNIFGMHAGKIWLLYCLSGYFQSRTQWSEKASVALSEMLEFIEFAKNAHLIHAEDYVSMLFRDLMEEDHQAQGGEDSVRYRLTSRGVFVLSNYNLR